MKRFLFITNFYNDVDHTAPLILDLLEKEHKVGVLGLTSYSLKDDIRVKELHRFRNFRTHFFSLLPRNTGTSNQKSGAISLPKKVFRELVFNFFFSLLFLKYYKYDVVIFTWGRPRAKGFQRQIFKATQALNIRSICIPHGQNIYINYDVNSALRAKFESTQEWPNFIDRNEFDAYIVQTERHRVQHVEWGMNPAKVHAWGSLRFDPNWVKINSGLYGDTASLLSVTPRNLSVVFFLPHWRYNVDEEACLELISRIIETPDIALRVKGHTRGDRLRDESIQRLTINEYVDLDCTLESTPLIDWADVVVNFGSSIALEAVVKKIPVIYPSFLHDNSTIFDDCDYVFNCQNYNDVISLLLKPQLLASISEVAEKSRQQLIKSEVFNSSECSHVAQYYSACILDMVR